MSMDLVSRTTFVEMLQTITDVTEERHTHVELTEPVCFNGYATQYRQGNRLLAEALHCVDGALYYIDGEWQWNHSISSDVPYREQISLGQDDRGYQFTLIKNLMDYPESESVRILAGCRNFSLQKAKEHWYENPEVYPRILMAEIIAAHRGWIEGKYLTPDYELAYKEAFDPEAEPQVDAGELACETTPTVVIHDWEEEPEGPTHEELRHQERLHHENANPER